MKTARSIDADNSLLTQKLSGIEHNNAIELFRRMERPAQNALLSGCHHYTYVRENLGCTQPTVTIVRGNGIVGRHPSED